MSDSFGFAHGPACAHHSCTPARTVGHFGIALYASAVVGKTRRESVGFPSHSLALAAVSISCGIDSFGLCV